MAVSAAFSETATAALVALTSRAIEHPGKLIKAGEFDESIESINVPALLGNVCTGWGSRAEAAGLSDIVVFIDSLRLAMLTECATDSYAVRIGECAQSYKLDWLYAFNWRFWRPDELTHFTPYKWVLMKLGFYECDLDRQIEEARAAVFVHRGINTPWGVAAFGTVQEYLTGNFHRLLASLFQLTSEYAATGIRRVEAREWLHTRLYRDMLVIQVEDRPEILPDVFEALLRFEMPGNQVVPELQAQATKYLPVLGSDLRAISGDLVSMLHYITRDVRTTGQLALRLAAEKGYSTRWISLQRVEAAINLLGGMGRGLIGEAVLAKYLPYTSTNIFDGRRMLDEGLDTHAFAEPVRRLLRGWIMKALPDNIAQLG